MKAEKRVTGLAGLSRDDNGYAISIFIITIVLIFLSRFVSENFGSWYQIQSILVLSALLVFIAFGQGLVILLGELDLSVGSLISLSGVLTTMWVGTGMFHASWGIPLILLIQALIGAVNGIGVTLLKIPSFIMTLAMQMIIFGIVLGYTKGTALGVSPSFLSKLMSERWGAIPLTIIMLILVTVIGSVIQKKTNYGRKLYAIGSSRSAAYLSGIPVKALIIVTFAVSGVCAGLTGMILVGYSGGATLTMGDSYLLPSIAMVVVGGTSMLGGSGSYLGTIGAAILLTTVSTIIQALGISQGWQNFIYGFMILMVLGLVRNDLYNLFSRFRKGDNFPASA